MRTDRYFAPGAHVAFRVARGRDRRVGQGSRSSASNHVRSPAGTGHSHRPAATRTPTCSVPGPNKVAGRGMRPELRFYIGSLGNAAVPIGISCVSR